MMTEAMKNMTQKSQNRTLQLGTGRNIPEHNTTTANGKIHRIKFIGLVRKKPFVYIIYERSLSMCNVLCEDKFAQKS
jgi:hypothetical protein